MIQTVNLYKSFGDRQVLNNISVTFEQGKTNLIIGKSGSGKTVLMKSLVGLLEIDSGQILYNDRDFSNLPIEEKREIRQEIGMLFQGGALFDSMNVLENVMFPLTLFTNKTYDEKRCRAEFCLNRVDLNKVNDLYPAELSGGMKKRVAIARAISNNPKYLFCDEPTSGLDPLTSIVIDKLISKITHDFQMTTVINTHDMNSMIEIGETIAFIHEGQLEWTGTKDEVLNTDNKNLNDFIFATELVRKIKTPNSKYHITNNK
jgi:phospholipid/cholesterol/gamma-HCH transport system ATP-binding protein